MNKSLITVALASVFVLATAAEEAEALSVSNDYTVITPSATFTFDEDGDKFSIGSNNLVFSHSDTVDAGIDYTAEFGLFSGTVSYDYTSDEDSVIGLKTSLAAYGTSVTPSATWNIQDSQFDTSVDVGYSMFGFDSVYTVDWDVSDMELTGTEGSISYGINFGNMTVRPSVSIPFDGDWERETTTLGLSISVSFGSVGS
jgi:hypothetical protein